MGTPIQQITIEGFKSIKKLDNFELRNLNILIGANGAGKSNFVETFRMLRAVAEGHLGGYVAKAGGSDGLFFGGPKASPKIAVDCSFGNFESKFYLEPTVDAQIAIANEEIKKDGQTIAIARYVLSPGVIETTKLETEASSIMSAWMVYHFHDTTALSPIRREQSIEDVAYLRPDAANIAAFLFDLREHHTQEYKLIRDTIRIVAPFFDDFLLKERTRGNETKVALDWRQKGSDFPFQPWHLSDGTIRFICLATALLQPNPPATIVIDEPELGLHPHALEILAGLLQKAAVSVQVIVSTQSAPLLSQFEPEDVITVSRTQGASTFGRLDKTALAEWLENYTLGELWQKNVVEAGAGND